MRVVLRLVVAILLCLFPMWGWAEQEDSLWWNRSAGYVVPIDEVAVEGRRPMKEIGQQKTTLNERVLHDNIASSMADILTFNSAIFVKQHGRASLSTISFRGTSAAHTQVLWNGLKIHSPMLGTTDFSLIPAYFIDQATLLHGTSSVATTGGGLGGAIVLESHTRPSQEVQLQFVQGVGSYTTFDEFLRLDYGARNWDFSTRVAYSTSQNDFHYTNYKRKEHCYDENHQIVASYYPTEVNRNCDFNDLHLMQEICHHLQNGDEIRFNGWYLHSRRGIPMMMIDYNQDRDFLNEQREATWRSVVSWDHLQHSYKIAARAGYVFSRQTYNYQKDLGNGTMNPLIASRNRLHTLFTEVSGEYYLAHWLFSASLNYHRHWVESRDDRSLVQERYDVARGELSASLSAKWAPIEPLGISLVLREEGYGSQWSPLIPALFVDWRLARQGNLTLKGSVSRNYRFPTLNDLYYKPGGNPDLRPERGFTYDAGIYFRHQREESYSIAGSATWFDSYIDDWILWQPTAQGYWSPKNLKKVHAYGIEVRGEWRQQLSRYWQFECAANFSWTPSINQSEQIGSHDQSVGKQLPYTPQYSASLSAALIWRSWRLGYKGNYYSERFTSTDNNTTSPLGSVKPYYLSEGSLEKRFSPRWAELNLKLNIKNLFDIEYESVLARPMPGIHFECFLEIRPHWGKSTPLTQ